MVFTSGLLIGIFVGSIMGASVTVFMMCNGSLNKEKEAYREGYEDGIANANKNINI